MRKEIHPNVRIKCRYNIQNTNQHFRLTLFFQSCISEGVANHDVFPTPLEPLFLRTYLLIKDGTKPTEMETLRIKIQSVSYPC